MLLGWLFSLTEWLHLSSPVHVTPSLCQTYFLTLIYTDHSYTLPLFSTQLSLLHSSEPCPTPYLWWKAGSKHSQRNLIFLWTPSTYYLCLFLALRTCYISMPNFFIPSSHPLLSSQCPKASPKCCLLLEAFLAFLLASEEISLFLNSHEQQTWFSLLLVFPLYS